MRRGRTTTRIPDAPSRPPPPDVRPREPWPVAMQQHGSFDGCRPVLMTAHSLLYGNTTSSPYVYTLPPWQRGEVWTAEQQVAFCETVWAGLPFSPILLWERGGWNGEPRSTIVLDGQQRLTALGAHVLRADGTRNTPTAAHLDLETGRWQVGPADGHPPVTMMEACSTSWAWHIRNRRDIWPDDDAWWRTACLIAEAADRLRGSQFVYLIGPSATVDDAVRVFRAWNVPGVAFPPDEVEALIRLADLSWRPPTPPVGSAPETTPRG